MSGLTCKSLGLSASFAKSLIDHIMSQSDGTTSMRDYMEKVRGKGETVVNPDVLKPERYVPTKPASVEANPLNAKRMDMQTVLNISSGDEFKEKGTRPIIINVEASIPNEELMKYFPEIKEKFKDYAWWNTMKSSHTTIVTTMDVDKDNKPVMQPLTTHSGKAVVGKDGKPVMVPKTDMRIVTYDPMGFGGGPRTTVADASLATDEIIIGAIKREAKITAEECASRGKDTAEAIRTDLSAALRSADGKIDSFSFSTNIKHDEANDEIEIELDVTSLVTADWEKLTH
jgi:hypothetical protein